MRGWGRSGSVSKVSVYGKWDSDIYSDINLLALDSLMIGMSRYLTLIRSALCFRNKLSKSDQSEPAPPGTELVLKS